MSPELLFPAPNREFLTLLAGLPAHLDAAMPMRRQHKRELPGDIRELSHLLTDERGDLRRDYLADPAALSAYLRYYLPWNIFRLGVLFRGLSLDPGGDAPDGAATIIDLGTGPLTAPLALWMSRPHLRKRPLTFICVDRAPKPMRLGLSVLESLAQSSGGLAPWKVTLVKGPLDARLREKADLLIMANALNEVLHRGEGDLLESADALAWHLASMLTPVGQLLLVEPGVRPSAHLIAALRMGLLRHGLHPLAPCPHTGPCPMSGRGYTAWCHFNFDAAPAPRWLKELSESARLAKDNVSLSLLHFSAKGGRTEAAPGKGLVRAVSGPFELPGVTSRRYGQYACTERGLTIVSMARKHSLPLPGALLELTWPENPDTDAKSGALVLPLGAEYTPPPREEPGPASGPASGPTSGPTTGPAAKPTGRTLAKPSERPARPSAKPSERPARPAPRPAKPARPARPGKPAPKEPGQALTVDALLADGSYAPDEALLREAGDAPARRGSKSGSKPAPKPGGKGKAPGKSGGKPASKSGGKPAGKSGGKPAGKSGGKPTGKASRKDRKDG